MRFFIVAAVVGTAIATNGSKECANKCTTKWEACKAALNANQSFCSSDYTSCLGFSPFSNGYIKPTACSSSTAEPTSTICFDCSAPTVKPTSTICFDCSAPTAKPTSTICFDCSAPTVKPTSTTCFDCSTPPLQPAQDPCAKKCTDLWVACKTTPNANQSFCSAQYASCLGFTPFKDSFSVPTACITTSVIASTSKPTTTICYDYVGGYPNGTTNNPYPSFTAAAGRVEPAILIAVFCAAALL